MHGSLIASNLLTPPVLFFALSMAATWLRSDLEIPQPLTRALSLYLLFSIGMHGGAELAAAGFAPAVVLPLALGVLASAAIPLFVFLILRRRLGVCAFIQSTPSVLPLMSVCSASSIRTYLRNRATGSFLQVDESTNTTAGAEMMLPESRSP